MSGADARQDCLSAEHAAVWGYGVLGGVLAGQDDAADLALAQESYRAHVERRDVLTELIAAAGATPVAAHAAYELPFPVADADDAARLARRLEERSSAVYASAIIDLDSSDRGLATDALTDCAIRVVKWGASPVALPGI